MDKHPEFPKPPPSIKDKEPSSGAGSSSQISQDEGTGQGGGGSTRPSGSSQAPTRDPTQNKNTFRPSDNLGGQSSMHSLDKNISREDIVGSYTNDGDFRATPPVLLRDPTRVEVLNLSEDDARTTFYSLCNLDRTSVVDDLIASLGSRPLLIILLASSIGENDWDEQMLLRMWGDNRTSALKDIVGSSFRYPTVQSLGTAALDILEVIATSPGGVKESMLDTIFPGIPGVRKSVAVLCDLSLLFREDGFVKTLSPLRFHFLDSVQTVVHTTENDTTYSRITDETTGSGAHNQAAGEDSSSIPCNMAMPCPFFHFISTVLE